MQTFRDTNSGAFMRPNCVQNASSANLSSLFHVIISCSLCFFLCADLHIVANKGYFPNHRILFRRAKASPNYYVFKAGGQDEPVQTFTPYDECVRSR